MACDQQVVRPFDPDHFHSHQNGTDHDGVHVELTKLFVWLISAAAGRRRNPSRQLGFRHMVTLSCSVGWVLSSWELVSTQYQNCGS